MDCQDIHIHVYPKIARIRIWNEKLTFRFLQFYLNLPTQKYGENYRPKSAFSAEYSPVLHIYSNNKHATEGLMH